MVVGGGPTGVEVAAELYDLVREEMGQYYPHICKDAKVRLVELQDHVLSTYDRKISEYTSQLFSRHGFSQRALFCLLGLNLLHHLQPWMLQNLRNITCVAVQRAMNPTLLHTLLEHSCVWLSYPHVQEQVQTAAFGQASASVNFA